MSFGLDINIVYCWDMYVLHLVDIYRIEVFTSIQMFDCECAMITQTSARE